MSLLLERLSDFFNRQRWRWHMFNVEVSNMFTLGSRKRHGVTSNRKVTISVAFHKHVWDNLSIREYKTSVCGSDKIKRWWNAKQCQHFKVHEYSINKSLSRIDYMLRFSRTYRKRSQHNSTVSSLGGLWNLIRITNDATTGDECSTCDIIKFSKGKGYISTYRFVI